ncbi:MAG TPA: oligopeptide/dipeptide ABC transporter ATP-binding protein [Burkholderiales bacterium]|nr:oligopeptide/dipeptide ABC transporter ATP-binding protein [Burkholderiales bacterium]
MSVPVPILEARALTKHFAGASSLPFRKAAPIRAVDGVSFSVRRGETFAIVGESGCGKSTLARMLLCLLEPTSGSVHYEGADVRRAGAAGLRRLRREMQIVFQDPYSSLNPRMTVGQLVGEPLAVHRIASGKARDRQVAELLRRVGLLPEHARRYPHEFSGGQRQRIGIARALACAPRLVIGDEPVSALDVSIRAQIVNLLEDLKREFDLTLVLVAHDLALIRHTCDRVAVMYLGEIVELGEAERVFEHPAHPYTRALLAAIPVPVPSARGRRQLPQGDPPSPAAPPPGCRFHPRCPHAMDKCKSQDPPLRDLGGGRAVACHLHG